MKAILTEGPPEKHMISLAWPMMIGVLAIVGFNMIDTFFIGKLGEIPLAAISFTFPIVLIVGSFAFGFALAVSSLVSRAIGEQQEQKVKELCSDGLSLSFLIVIVLSVIGLLTVEPLFRALGAKGQTLEYVLDYMGIWYFNLIFVVIPIVGNGAIRGTGDTKSPAIIMITAGLVNFIFDPLLIFGWGPFPRLELEGAAIATIISRIFTLLASLYILHWKMNLLAPIFRPTQSVFNNWLAIVRIGTPAGINNAIVPISMAIITAFVAKYGDLAVAGFGVGTRIEAFVAIILVGLSAALGPFVGQNWGAKKQERIHNAYRFATKYALLWIVGCSVCVLFLGQYFIAVFNTAPTVIRYGHHYLLWTIPSLAFHAFLLNSNAYHNALGNPHISMMLTSLRMLVVYIPAAWFLSINLGALGIFVAGALANVIAGTAAYFSYRKRHLKSLQPQS